MPVDKKQLSATERRRKDVHPILLRKIDKVLEAMNALGFPMMITDGARTAEQQNWIWQQGRSRPGSIVTNADGFEGISNHQIRDDGYGYAVDCTFLDINGKPTWSMQYPWSTYGSCCKAVGLRHGIKLNSQTIDWPHAELPEQVA